MNVSLGWLQSRLCCATNAHAPLIAAPFMVAVQWSKVSMDIFLQQIINGLVLGSMYALVALGYTMVYGIIGLINFCFVDFIRSKFSP